MKGSKGEEDVVDIEHGDVADSPVGSAEGWACDWIVQLNIQMMGLACIHMRCTDMVDRVGGHHYPFPAKDIDITSSSFANK